MATSFLGARQAASPLGSVADILVGQRPTPLVPEADIRFRPLCPLCCPVFTDRRSFLVVADTANRDKYMTENLVSHWLGDKSLHGREAWTEAMANFFDAFPDAAYTLTTSSSQATKAYGGEPGMPRSVSSGREFLQLAARRSGR